MSSRRLRAATLAVGTEVTDGQILDRNSAWLSQKLVNAGLEVIEHRAVADEASDIARALGELTSRIDLLFITGGLGPTSDDFTRNIIAEVYGRPLEFDAESWAHIGRQLGARGIEAREIQKQQCYFPKGSRVLVNMAGTANAFAFTSENGVRIHALPGPPGEIAAVWNMHLAAEIESLVPAPEREKLRVIRCMGLGESAVAEIVEELLEGAGLRVGYRAHAPYVEVKIWFRERDAAAAAPVLVRIETALSAWLVNRDGEDVADPLIEFGRNGKVWISDWATKGMLAERIFQRVRDLAAGDALAGFVIETRLGGAVVTTSPGAGASLVIDLSVDAAGGAWQIMLEAPGKPRSVLAEKPTFNYQVLSERGCKYITEKVLIAAGRFIAPIGASESK